MNWTSVKDLPPMDERVLIYTKGEVAYMGEFTDHHHVHFIGDKYNFELDEIMCWCYVEEPIR